MTQPSCDIADPAASVPSWEACATDAFESFHVPCGNNQEIGAHKTLQQGQSQLHVDFLEPSLAQAKPMSVYVIVDTVRVTSSVLAAPRTATVRTLRDIHQRPVRQHSSFHWPQGMDFTTILPDHAHTCNLLAVDTSPVQVHCNFVLLHSTPPCFFRAHTIGVRSNSCNANQLHFGLRTSTCCNLSFATTAPH